VMSKRERITRADVCVERVTLAQASYDAADDAGSIPAEGAH
jgi:hypothetical protein